ncbi:MAG: hypothetical protein UZ07_CHB004001114 [Chlorobi bacterium OLB7]|nr:MAG: hypothetical protein UZ07_CHB004001114 [Chlorobi bacterium OLB7]
MPYLASRHRAPETIINHLSISTMNTFLRLLSVWIAATAAAIAQAPSGDIPLCDPPMPRWHVGPTSALLLNSHPGANGAGNPGEPEQRMGFALGIGAGYDLTSEFEISGRLEYRSMPGRVVYPVESFIILPSSVEPHLLVVTTTTDIPQFRAVDLALSAAFKPRLLRRLSGMVAVGAFLRSALEGTHSQFIDFPDGGKPINPAGFPTEHNGQRLILKPYQEISDLNKVGGGVTGGIGVQYRYGSTRIIPAIWYDHSLTNVTSSAEEDGWRVHSLAFRVDVRMEL